MAPRSARFQPGLAISVLHVVSDSTVVDSTQHRNGLWNGVIIAVGVGFVAGNREGEVGKRRLFGTLIYSFFLVSVSVVALYRHLYIVYSVFSLLVTTYGLCRVNLVFRDRERK